VLLVIHQQRPAMLEKLQMNERRLTRKQASAFLREYGYPVSDNEFVKRCWLGRGPTPDCKWGRKLLYLPSVVLAWAESELRPVTVTAKRTGIAAEEQPAA
jgi:hypothetical protein